MTSSSSNASVESLLASFPKTPAKIEGKPTYEMLKTLKETLIENAASIESTRGGGQHGLLGLVVTPDECTAQVDADSILSPHRTVKFARAWYFHLARSHV